MYAQGKTIESVQNDDAFEREVSNTAADVAEITEVLAEGMVIVGGVYYGISKSWYETNNPNGEFLYLSLNIPDNVTKIHNDGFRDGWSSDKQKQGCITNYNYDSDKSYTNKYTVVGIDFSSVVNLTVIESQAALSCSDLSGVLDLSRTKLETLGKSAFSGCTGLMGVILPETLKNIGSRDSGSVFNGCTGLQYIRSTDGDANAVFELPENLEVIGRQSFKGCTAFPANTAVSIPVSVAFVGSETFYKSPGIATIYVQASDASAYDEGAFKGDSYGLGNRLTVFGSSSAKKSFVPSGSGSYTNSLTYEFTLYYDTVKTEKKLWDRQSMSARIRRGTGIQMRIM